VAEQRTVTSPAVGMASVVPAARGAAGGRAGAGGHQTAVAAVACVVAACAVAFAGSAAGASGGRESVLAGLDVAALEAAAATALPGTGRARTQALADADDFAARTHVVYGNDASGDDVELQPVGGSGARTQALYDTAGINTGAGGLITPMQRVTVRPTPLLACAWRAPCAQRTRRQARHADRVWRVRVPGACSPSPTARASCAHRTSRGVRLCRECLRIRTSP
jgi:hypothetical protein